MEENELSNLAERIAERAINRALEATAHGAKEAQQAAIDRAVRDANVDRDLRQHAEQIQSINGSQKRTAEALEELTGRFEQQAAVTDGIAAYIQARSGISLSRKSLVIALLAAIAAYGTIVAIILTAHA